MRSTLLLVLFASLLAGCPTEEVVEDPDVIWVPALETGDTGTLDLGEIPAGVTTSGEIELTNNTEAEMVVTIALDLPEDQGFWGSGLHSSQEATLAAGATTAVEIKINPTVGVDISGPIDFVFDNRVVAWTVRGTAVP